MTLRLRVAGWLRFANKSRLDTALRAYLGSGLPSAEVSGLDVVLRVEVEHPDSSEYLARPFVTMVDAAAHGYVDFDDGVTARRWTLAYINTIYNRTRRRAIVTWAGTGKLDLDGTESPLELRGHLDFADEKAAEAALGDHTYKLPFLEAERMREVELGPEVFRRRGKSVEVGAVVHGPPTLQAPIIETFIATARRAKRGVVTLQLPDRVEPSSTGYVRIPGASLSVAAGGVRHLKNAKGQGIALAEVRASSPRVREAA